MVNHFAAGHSSRALVSPIGFVQFSNHYQWNPFAGEVTGELDETMNIPGA